MKLYEIIPALKKLEDLQESSQEDLTEYLDGVQLQLNDKVNGIVRFQKNMEANASAIDIEIARLSKLKSIYENTASRLKDYMGYELQKNGIEKLETEIAKLSFRKSESLKVTDEKLIPSEFVQIKEYKTVDKLAVKKAIKEGRQIDGAVLIENKNLQIK